MRNERSGVPSPDSISPWSKCSGGKVTGMRITRTFLPAAPSSFQKVSPCRRLTGTGRSEGSQFAATQ